MRRTKPLTAREQTALEESWTEIGESIASAIVVGKKTAKWAWDLIGPLGIYKRWMIDMWIERYKAEHPEAENKQAKKPRRGPVSNKLKFTKREQIQEALRMLGPNKVR